MSRNIDIEALCADKGLRITEQRRVIARVRAVQEGYKSGDITDEQMQRVIQRLGSSPLMTVATIEFFEQQYIEPSELAAEEKAFRTVASLARKSSRPSSSHCRRSRGRPGNFSTAACSTSQASGPRCRRCRQRA